MGANTSFVGGRVTAGDLNLVYGEGSWTQITPGVTQPASGALADGTDGFVTMPGDVIEIRIPITTTLRGDNLNAKLLVSAGSGADKDIADGVIAASYRVENQAGEQAAPEAGEAELGETVDVRGLVSSNDGVTAQWQVVVTVKVTADYRWTDAEPMLDLRQWVMGGVNISLEQVREGPGFTEAGDA
ncbi:hypothetical protein G7067_00305 [Leucobacter insecticola]|uniref:Alternate-type signal peptide domain-containing protein n=1 Tax=Leucobacter insecticola TaxID=2714934 RepID=A0A6G8FFJ2_9MICO|nr:hypothetical protein [Leucobacter insecticola]QIM15206.1 hypothetical protein G7067_00305 [Leucobacter insecticola]